MADRHTQVATCSHRSPKSVSPACSGIMPSIDDLEYRVQTIERALTELRAEAIFAEIRMRTDDEPVEEVVRHLIDR